MTVQGLTRAGPVIEENSLVTGLWVHETLRVFYDRLINDEDRTWLTGLLASMGQTLAENPVSCCTIETCATATSMHSLACLHHKWV